MFPFWFVNRAFSRDQQRCKFIGTFQLTQDWFGTPTLLPWRHAIGWFLFHNTQLKISLHLISANPKPVTIWHFFNLSAQLKAAWISKVDLRINTVLTTWAAYCLLQLRVKVPGGYSPMCAINIGMGGSNGYGFQQLYWLFWSQIGHGFEL